MKIDAYYDTMRSYYRHELGVMFACHVARGGYTMINPVGERTDAGWCFDHSAFSPRIAEQELRNMLRRYARELKRPEGE